MKRRIFVAVEIAVLAVCLLALNLAFRLLSAPSDAKVVAGVAIILIGLIVVPSFVLWIRDRLAVHHKEEVRKVVEEVVGEKSRKGETDEKTKGDGGSLYNNTTRVE